VMTSPDGETWTPRTPPVGEWKSVAYGKDGDGDGLWVAVAGSGTKRVMTSTNGTAWTAPVALAAEASEWGSVAYGKDIDGDGLWVAVAYWLNEGGTHYVMTSPDGGTWAAQTAAEASGWFSVAYGDGLWVAVARSGTHQVMTSTNGIVWTARADVVAEAGEWRSVAYENGLWVAVSDGGMQMVGGAVSDSGTNRVMTSGATFVKAPPAAPSPPSVSCVPSPLVAGASVTCAVTGGDPGIDILWQAAYNPVFAGAGVALDANGDGTFSFTVPAAALGQAVTVELVEWAAPVSLGVAGGPVPTSVPSGGGPVSVWSLVLLVLAGGLVLRRMSAVGVRG